MRIFLTALILASCIVLPSFAQATAGLTYHGKIIKPDGQPLEGSSVDFHIQLKSPNAENCLLFDETQTLDMSNSNGVFVLTIGQGTRVAAGVDGGNSLDKIFSNRGTLTGLTCAVGSTYVKGTADGRKLVVQFNDGSGWQSLPSSDINFMPMSIESMQVAGYGKDQLLRVADGVTATEFSGANWTALWDLITGTSNVYQKADGSNFAPSANVDFGGYKVVDVADPTAAQDAATKNYVDGRLLGAAIAAPAAGQVGQSIRWKADGTGWEYYTPSSTDATKLPLIGGTMSGGIAMGNNAITGLAAPSAGGDAVNKTYADAISTAKVSKAGDTMTGLLLLSADPSNAVGAATKQYVDAVATTASSVYVRHDGTVALSNDWDLNGATAGGTRLLTGLGTPSVSDGAATKGYVDTATAAVGTAANTYADARETAAKTYADGKLVTKNLAVPAVGQDQQSIKWDQTAGTWVYYTPSASDATKLPLAGGTMSGAIAMGTSKITGMGDPTAAQDAATKAYVDAADLKLITKNLAQPVAGDDLKVIRWNQTAGNFEYAVDSTTDSSKLPLAGGTMTGAITLAADPSAAMEASTKQYADARETAAKTYADGKLVTKALAVPTNTEDQKSIKWDQTAGTWVYYVPSSSDASKLPLAGGTMSGAIAMGTSKITGMGDPTAAQDAATKAYADANLRGQALANPVGQAGKSIRWNAGDTAWEYYTPSTGTGDFLRDGTLAMTGNLRLGNQWLSNDGGSEGIRVTDDGHVGVGTSSPNAGGTSTNAARTYLTVKGSTGSGVLQLTSAAADADNSNLGNFEWVDSNSSDANKRAAYISVLTQGATANNRGSLMAFATRDNNGTAAAERMRIDNLGNVSIAGTTGGIARLDVRGSTSDATANAFNVRNMANSMLLVRNDGNIGINTTSPNAKLDVKGSIVMSGSGSGYSGFKVPAAAGSTIYELPAAAPASNMILQSDSSGILTWVAPASGSDASKLPLAGGTMSGNIIMGGNSITGLGAPALGGDAANKTYADANLRGQALATPVGQAGKSIRWNAGDTAWEYFTPLTSISSSDVTTALTYTPVNKAGDTMSGALAMGSNKITGLADPTAAQEAATKAYSDANILGKPLAIPAAGQVGQSIRWNAGNTAWEYYTPTTSIGADSLNFTDLSDTLALDASTSITAPSGQAFALSVVNEGTGNSFFVGDEATDTTPFVVKDDGKVGIGTAAPNFKLQVAGDIGASTLYASGNGTTAYSPSSATLSYPNSGAGVSASMYLDNQSATDSYASYLNMSSRNGNTNVQRSYIGNVSTSGAGAFTPAMVFGQSTAVNAYAERMRIDSSGNLALGTVTANALLTVEGVTSLREVAAPTASADYGKIYVKSADSKLYYMDDAGVETQLGAGGAAGIADDSLDFNKFADTLTLDTSTEISVGAANVFSITNTGTGNSFVVRDEGADTTPFVIDPDGKVGVGVATPADQLHVSAAMGAAFAKGVLRISETTGANNMQTGLLIERENSTGAGSAGMGSQIMFTGETASTNNRPMSSIGTVWTNSVDANRSADLLFSTVYNGAGSASERMRIQSDGKVGINTNAPNGQFDVKGSIVMSGSASGYSGFRVPAAAGSTVYELPAAAPASNMILQSDSSGILTWVAAASGTDASKLPLTGGTMSGAIAMGTSQITGLGDPTVAQDAATKAYADANILGKALSAPAAGQVGQSIRWNAGNTAWEYYTPTTSIAADSLNFVDLSDTLALDASTDIAADGAEVLSITNGGTGNSFLVNDATGGDASPFLIDTDGNVAIGKATASSKLDVDGEVAATSGFKSIDGNDVSTLVGGLLSMSQRAVAGQGSALLLVAGEPKAGEVDESGGQLELTAGNSTGTGGSVINFWTATPGAPGATVNYSSIKAHLDQNGRFSIGAPIANELLTVDGIASLKEVAAPSQTANYGKIYVKSADSKLYYMNDSGAETQLGGGASALADDSLNFDKFSDTLTLDASTSITAPSGQAYSLSLVNEGTGNSLFVGDDAADATPFVINAAGQVGIGTASPLGKVHIAGDETTGLVVGSDLGASTLTNAANKRGSISIPHYLSTEDPFGLLSARSTATLNELNIGGGNNNIMSATDIYFYTGSNTVDHGGNTRMSIRSSGKVGIGTWDPKDQLTVEGVTSMREVASAPSATLNYGKIYVKSSDGKLYFMNNAGSEMQVGSALGADSLNFTDLSDSLALDASTDIAVDNAEVLSVTNTGTGASFVVNDEAADATNFTIDAAGSVGVGVAPGTSKVTVAGVIESTSGGVKFPDGTTQTTAAAPYVMGGTFNGTLANSQVLMQHPFPIAVTIPINCTNSRFEFATAATASTTLTMSKCTGAGFSSCTAFGTAVVAAGQKVATFTCAAATSFTAGSHSILITGPATADTTAATAGWAIYGTR